MSLSGKTAIVTGGARGIGEAIVKRLAEAGATVVAGDVQRPGYELPDRVEYAPLDVTSEQDWSRVVGAVVGERGHIDILVNNAGTAPRSAIDEVQLDEWNRAIAIMQTGPLLGMREVLPHMIARRSGAIINISSVWGIQAVPGNAAYHAVKGAVRIMSKNAAVTYGKFGIRVNSVHPGVTETPLLKSAVSEEEIAAMRAKSPMARLAAPLDIANAVAFLVSDEAGYVNGHELVVDGGTTAAF